MHLSSRAWPALNIGLFAVALQPLRITISGLLHQRRLSQLCSKLAPLLQAYSSEIKGRDGQHGVPLPSSQYTSRKHAGSLQSTADLWKDRSLDYHDVRIASGWPETVLISCCQPSVNNLFLALLLYLGPKEVFHELAIWASGQPKVLCLI